MPQILPENIPLNIIYEDDDIILINKPKGMVVHPAAGHYTGTVVNALMYHCRDNLSGIKKVRYTVTCGKKTLIKDESSFSLNDGI